MAFRKPLDLTDGRGDHDSNVGLGLGLGCSFTTLCPMEHNNAMRDVNSMVNMTRDNTLMNLNRDNSMVNMLRDNNRTSMMDLIRDNNNMIDMNRDNSSIMNMHRDNSMMNVNTIRDNSMMNTSRDVMVNMIRDNSMVNMHSDNSIGLVNIGRDNSMVNPNRDKMMVNMNVSIPQIKADSVMGNKPANVKVPPKTSSKNQGKPVGNKNNYSEQSQQIVLNVYKNECRKKLKGAIARTARSTGIHRLTISKIVKAGVPKTPKKPGSKKKRYAKLDNFMRDDIRQVIHAFYKDGQPPTIEMVYQKLNQKDAKFPYGKSHLRNIIKSLGFKHSRVNKRTVIMESPSGDINSFVLELKGAT